MDNIIETVSRLTPGMEFGYSLLNEDKESFGKQELIKPDPAMVFIILISILVSLYLALKNCRKRFDIGQILLAIFFSPIYIAYRLAFPCKP